ncbi:MAG: ferritin-like domain-containing protein [Actinomycetota bacterium]
MDANGSVINTLNALWTVKRALIDQNVARSKVCEARGQTEVANRFSSIAFGHMREVATLLDRIVALDGMPELQTVDAVPVGDTLAEQLRLSLAAERATTERYQETLSVCEQQDDTETGALVGEALKNQRGHMEWLEGELRETSIVKD